MNVLLEPVLVDCIKDVVVCEREVILEFIKLDCPLINLSQRNFFDVNFRMLAA